MGEMTNAVSTMIGTFLTDHTAAIGPMLLLAVCAVLFATVRRYRAQLSLRQALFVEMASLLSGFGVIALQIVQDGWLVDVDRAVTAWLVGHRTHLLDVAAATVSTTFGPAETAAAAVVLAVVVAVRLHSVRGAFIVATTIGGGAIACAVLKIVVARSRPPITVQVTLETDYAFPSGHVTGTVVLLGMAVAVAAAGFGTLLRRITVALAVLSAALVAVSRLYLGVHWLSDVIAAMLLGATVLAVGARALTAVVLADGRRGRQREPDAEDSNVDANLSNGAVAA